MNLRKNLLMMLVYAIWLAPAHIVMADDCDAAKKLYNEGSTLADDSERVISFYKRAIELCPGFFEVHNKLGEVHKRRGEYDLAIKEFQLASKNPYFAEPFYNLGEIHRMQGQYDLAVKELTNAIRIKPDFRMAMNQLKYVYKRLGMYDTVLYTIPARDRAPSSIFTRIAGPNLPKGAWLVDFQYKYWFQTADLTEDLLVAEQLPPQINLPFERKTDVHVLNLGVRYGLTNNFTIGLIPRLSSRTIFAESPLGEAEPRITGLSDTVLMVKYRLLRDATLHVSPYFLLSIPTGDKDADGEDNGIVRRSPLGSGSFDLTPGLTATLMRDPLTIHTSISYRITDGEHVGDEFYFDLAMAFQTFYDLISVVELNYRWRDTVERQEVLQTAFFRPETGPPFIPDPGGPIPAPPGTSPPFIPSPGGPIAIPRIPPGPDNLEVTVMEKAGHTLFLSAGIEAYLHEELKAELGIQIPIIKPEAGWVEQTVFHVGLVRFFF